MLVPRGRARCPVHERKRDAERGTAHERGYDARWRAYRLDFLRDHPLCVLCLPRVVAATVVDHVRAHCGDPLLFWDPSNHRALCKACHDKRIDEGDFGR